MTIKRLRTLARPELSPYAMTVLAGLLYPLAFAPFKLPGMMLLSLALFYSQLINATPAKAIKTGLLYGVSLFGFGVSWIVISIHDYGDMNYYLAGLITLGFVLYLSSFMVLFAVLFSKLQQPLRPLYSALSFAALWVGMEWLRAHLWTGFPWLIAGTSQIEAPLRYLAPLFGVYGISLFIALAAAFVANSFSTQKLKEKLLYLTAFVLIMTGPLLLESIQWTEVEQKPLSASIIQLNLSMRDKWDDQLFWDIMDSYEAKTEQALGRDLIIMPESAIPAPDVYVKDQLVLLNKMAKLKHSAILLGIVRSVTPENNLFNNAVVALGQAKGSYAKRHLVPFGEYIPSPFQALNRWLAMIPDSELIEGRGLQKPITVKGIPIATLICYEIAYPTLLRAILPQAKLIISVSDNGWFGRSLASFQQLQMAQILSLQTGRWQAVANNDGLSSVIDNNGKIVKSLPAFQAGLLETSIYPAIGSTPWIRWGDYPVAAFILLTLVFCSFARLKK